MLQVHCNFVLVLATDTVMYRTVATTVPDRVVVEHGPQYSYEYSYQGSAHMDGRDISAMTRAARHIISCTALLEPGRWAARIIGTSSRTSTSVVLSLLAATGTVLVQKGWRRDCFSLRVPPARPVLQQLRGAGPSAGA